MCFQIINVIPVTSFFNVNFSLKFRCNCSITKDVIVTLHEYRYIWKERSPENDTTKMPEVFFAQSIVIRLGMPILVFVSDFILTST